MTRSLIFVLVTALALWATAVAGASQMFATDLHVHSTVSADARPDLGIIARSAKAAGLNAVFLTDHNQASDFSISTRTANNAFFDAAAHDDLNRWTPVGAGVTQVASPVHSGTAATHIVSTGPEQYLWSVRGPNFRPGSGAVTTKFSLFPTSLPAGASFYISASFGGDVTIQNTAPGPEGYTPAQSGIAASCKSVVFIWYFGAAPSTAPYQPTATACKVSPIPPVVVKEFPITAAQCDKAFTLNTWNTCTLDVDAAVATLAAADKPQPYLGLSELKVAASGNADVVVDDYATAKALPAGSTVDSRAGAEFAERNALIPQYDDPAGNFRMFPSLEEGTNNHTQRFNFGITTPGQYTTFCNGTCNYSNGYTGIAPTQASGYPAQLNHPGVAGGVTDAQATGSCPNGLTPACGADVMEVRQRNMSNDWDTILKTGMPLVGTWGSDNHVGTWSGSSQSTYLFSPSNSFDDLMQATFEGRGYDALLGTSTTRMSMLFNVGTSAAEPYPARYPLFVPAGQSVSLHVDVTHVKAASSARWVQNGVIGANEAATAGNYSATRTLTMSGASAYARVEVGTSATADADGTTQAIMLKPAAAGVPADMRYHVERVTPPAGQPAFTTTMTKGITASSWGNQALTLSLADRAGSLVETRITSSTAPTTVTVNGAAVAAAASLAAFQAATGASWFYDGTTAYVKEVAANATDTVVVSFGGAGGDVTPPSAPGTPAATSIGTTNATISWTASTDNVGVTRYDVSRNGAFVGSVTPPATGSPTFTDTGLTPATTYSYVVTAFDAAGNHTASPPGSVTTQAATGGGTTTLTAVADAKVDASTPTTNFGTVALRVDATPDVSSYVKFDATGITGTVTSATLRIWATSSQSTGFDVYPVSDSSWTETGLTYANQPTAIGAKLGSSGPVTTGTWKTIDVTSLVRSPGVYSVVLRTTSGTALSLASREDAVHAPQLVVVTSAGSADTTAPTAPGTPAATAVGTTTATISWTRSSDDVGVVRYDVSRNGTVVGSAPQPASGNPSFSDTGLTGATTYSYVVTAFDAAGNHTASAAGSVTTTAAADTTPPSKPVVSATPTATTVALTWPRATDNVAVTRYDITRGTTLVGSVPQPASGGVGFTDTGLAPSTAFSYVVTAFDAAGNSTASDPVPVTTLAAGGGGTTTLTAIADAKVDASTPATNFATAALRVDASPDVRSYVKFDATGITGTVQSATLRIWATSAQSVGFDAYPVGDSSWTETGLTYANQPSASIGVKLGSSGAVVAATWKTIDVTAMVTGPGTYSVVLETTSATALALASREDAAHAPQLVVTTG